MGSHFGCFGGLRFCGKSHFCEIPFSREKLAERLLSPPFGVFRRMIWNVSPVETCSDQGTHFRQVFWNVSPVGMCSDQGTHFRSGVHFSSIENILGAENTFWTLLGIVDACLTTVDTLESFMITAVHVFTVDFRDINILLFNSDLGEPDSVTTTVKV